MVFSSDISKEIDMRIDRFLLEWGAPLHNIGYRFVKETVAYMVAHPGMLPYSCMKDVAKICGINYSTYFANVGGCIAHCKTPGSSECINEKFRPKEFLILCMNTILQER